MCLLVLAYQQHPRFPLILLAHRDEYHGRPTAPAGHWQDADIVGGRDLTGGGSWLAADRNGRFAALTNVREGPPQTGARSRGLLVSNYLRSHHTPDSYRAALDADETTSADYSGYNLLLGQRAANQWQMFVVSNRYATQHLLPGLYGLSNAGLDSPWPKVQRAKAVLDTLLSGSDAPDPGPEWLDALRDETPAPDDALPDTGIGRDKERWLSPGFITGDSYGTRAASLLSCDNEGRWLLFERSHAAATGSIAASRRLRF